MAYPRHDPKVLPSLKCREHPECRERKRTYNRMWKRRKAQDPDWRANRNAQARARYQPRPRRSRHDPKVNPAMDCREHEECRERRRLYDRAYYQKRAADPAWRAWQARRERKAWRRRARREKRRCGLCGAPLRRHSLLGCDPKHKEG